MLPYGACQMCRKNMNNKCKWTDVCDSHNFYEYDPFKVDDILRRSCLKESYNTEIEEQWMTRNNPAHQFVEWYRANAIKGKEQSREAKRKEHSDMKMPEIKNVKFNDPATIVFWSDGTKTVVKAGENDIFDPEKGLAMAIVKKVYGNVGRYYNNIGKWVDEYYEKKKEPSLEEAKDIFEIFANMKFGI